MKTTKELIDEGKLEPERAEAIKNILPPRYREASIEEVEPKVREWLFASHKDGKGLYLYGPVGTGKTYAAYAIYRTLKENKVNCKIINTARMLQEIKNDFSPRAKDPYYRSEFDQWIDYNGVLLLDDLGAEKVTDWVLETFYQLVNERYENMRPTIFTSNYSVAEIADRLGDRIASRITEMTERLELKGRDRRV